MPKIEYQPEFGFEKITEEQLVEYWLDTYFRTPKSKLILGNKLLLNYKTFNINEFFFYTNVDKLIKLIIF